MCRYQNELKRKDSIRTCLTVFYHNSVTLVLRENNRAGICYQKSLLQVQIPFQLTTSIVLLVQYSFRNSSLDKIILKIELWIGINRQDCCLNWVRPLRVRSKPWCGLNRVVVWTEWWSLLNSAVWTELLSTLKCGLNWLWSRLNGGLGRFVFHTEIQSEQILGKTKV